MVVFAIKKHSLGGHFMVSSLGGSGIYYFTMHHVLQRRGALPPPPPPPLRGITISEREEGSDLSYFLGSLQGECQ